MCPKEYRVASSKDICTLMFIAALFMIAKRWEQPRCPSKGKQSVVYINTYDRMLFSLKKE
jgi:hypothetical protein